MALKNENVRHVSVKIDGEFCDHISIVAYKLGVTTATVKGMIKRGELTGMKLAEGYWIPINKTEKLKRMRATS